MTLTDRQREILRYTRECREYITKHTDADAAALRDLGLLYTSLSSRTLVIYRLTPDGRAQTAPKPLRQPLREQGRPRQYEAGGLVACKGTCGQSYPFDKDHFYTEKSGRMRPYCWSCYREKARKREQERKATP